MNANDPSNSPNNIEKTVIFKIELFPNKKSLYFKEKRIKNGITEKRAQFIEKNKPLASPADKPKNTAKSISESYGNLSFLANRSNPLHPIIYSSSSIKLIAFPKDKPISRPGTAIQLPPGGRGDHDILLILRSLESGKDV